MFFYSFVVCGTFFFSTFYVQFPFFFAEHYMAITAMKLERLIVTTN